MDTNIGESASRDPQNSSCSPSSSGSSSDADNFECNICLDLAQDPIVTLCGHLFCWPCLYKWLHLHANSSECPVCKVVIKENQLVPLYGRGKTSTDLQYKSITGVDIPQRPPGLRPATAPQANPNHYPHGNPWFMGGAPMANGGWGNYTFSPGIWGLFPMLGFQVHEFPGTGAYGPAAGFPYGFGRSFHGRHGHGAPEQAEHGHQPDAYLKTLLILVGSFVVASLVMF